MRAVRLVQYKQPLESVEVPVREPGRGEVLVRVEASAVCHSDIPVMQGIRPVLLPITLGHECAGVVAAVGPEVEDVSPGARVSIFYVLSCGRCEACRRGLQNACPHRRSIGLHQDGGFAEFVTVPAGNVVPLPEGVSFPAGAIAGCAVSTALHAIRVTGVEAGDRIAVVGLGGVGLHLVQLARLQGAALVLGIDRNVYKQALARELGVDVFVPADAHAVEHVMELTAGAGVDAAFECAGVSEAYQTALSLAKAGGRVGLVGVCTEPIQFRPFPLLLKEIRVMFVANHTWEEQRRVLGMMQKGVLDLSRSITHRLPLAQANDGFELLQEERNQAGKIVLIP